MSTTTARWSRRLPEQLPASAGLSLLAGLAVLTYLGGLTIATQVPATSFENPADPMNAIVFVAYILAATGAILVAAKLDLFGSAASLLKSVFAAGVVGFVGLYSMLAYVFVLPAEYVLVTPLLGFGVALGLHYTRHWTLQNIAAVSLGMIFIGVWGKEFGVLPALFLLTIMLVYDALSVYVTGHMKTLASEMLDSNLAIPAFLVVPLRVSELSSFRAVLDDNAESASDDNEEGAPERIALGTGDIVIPGILVVSASVYAPAPALSGTGGLVNLPGAAAIAGILTGYAGLYYMLASRGGEHAGLPWLNGGAIAGYLFGCLASGIPLAAALGLQAGVGVVL